MGHRRYEPCGSDQASMLDFFLAFSIIAAIDEDANATSEKTNAVFAPGMSFGPRNTCRARKAVTNACIAKLWASVYPGIRFRWARSCIVCHHDLAKRFSKKRPSPPSERIAIEQTPLQNGVSHRKTKLATSTSPAAMQRSTVPIKLRSLIAAVRCRRMSLTMAQSVTQAKRI